MKPDRKTLEAVYVFHSRMKADAALRTAFDAIMDFEIASRISVLCGCDPSNVGVISGAQERIKFANSLKNHDDLVKTSSLALKRQDGE